MFLTIVDSDLKITFLTDDCYFSLVFRSLNNPVKVCLYEEMVALKEVVALEEEEEEEDISYLETRVPFTCSNSFSFKPRADKDTSCVVQCTAGM